MCARKPPKILPSHQAPPSPAEVVHPLPQAALDVGETDSVSAKLAATDALLAGLSAADPIPNNNFTVVPLGPPSISPALQSVGGGAPVLTPPQVPPSLTTAAAAAAAASDRDSRSTASAPVSGHRSAPVLTPPRPPTACGHPSSAGQELCYLCHQRARRNVPVSFADELRRRELEEDRLLQAYQFMRDREKIIDEQVRAREIIDEQVRARKDHC